MGGLAGFLRETEKLLLVAHPRLQFAGVGQKSKIQHGSPPRIVWYIANGQHAAAEKQKPPGTKVEQAHTPRQILTRRVTVVAVVWGKDLDETEQLVDSAIAALYMQAHGSISFGGEDWPADDVEDNGLVAELQFSLHARVNARRFLVADPVKDSNYTTAPQPLGLDVDASNAP